MSLAAEPSEEAQAEHLGKIRSAVQGAVLETHDRRLKALESFKAQAEFQVMNLTEQMQAVIESQKREDTEAHKALRRSILALALTEMLWAQYGKFYPAEVDDYDNWEDACAEVYRRYGGSELGLWKKPPEPPSPETKALMKVALRRRQEA